MILALLSLGLSAQSVLSSDLNNTQTAITHCSGRGGCDCDCSWASSSTCRTDDGSCCWGCCCSSGPAPAPAPAPSPSPSGMKLYCPKSTDLIVAYGSASLFNQGWTVKAGGAAATKSSYNLLGGYVEYDIDFSAVRTGVNANIYTISPYVGSGGFNQNSYCDGAKTGSGFCLEVDWVESNGNCGGATTLHTIEGGGSNGCTAWGCSTEYHYNGRSSYHMRVEYSADGVWKTIRDGKTINPSDLHPTPGSYDWNKIKTDYTNRGAVIYSSEWTGWVPVSDCGTKGDLSASYFTVKNLKIYGKVVGGPAPSTC